MIPHIKSTVLIPEFVKTYRPEENYDYVQILSTRIHPHTIKNSRTFQIQNPFTAFHSKPSQGYIAAQTELCYWVMEDINTACGNYLMMHHTMMNYRN